MASPWNKLLAKFLLLVAEVMDFRTCMARISFHCCLCSTRITNISFKKISHNNLHTLPMVIEWILIITFTLGWFDSVGVLLIDACRFLLYRAAAILAAPHLGTCWFDVLVIFDCLRHGLQTVERNLLWRLDKKKSFEGKVGQDDNGGRANTS